MVVSWGIEELFVRGMSVAIILCIFDVEITDPSELTVNVTVPRNFRVLGNASALDFILVVRVHIFLLCQLSNSRSLCQLKVFVEVDLVINMVLLIKRRRSNMMAVVPPGVRELSVICVVGNDLFFRHFEACRVTHSASEPEDSFGIFPPQRRIPVASRNWRPHLSKNSNTSRHIQQLISI